MRRPIRIIGAVLVFVSLVLAMARLFEDRAQAPVLNVVNVEPSLVFDDGGLEMRLLNLSISNASPARGVSGDIWVRILSSSSLDGTTNPPIQVEPKKACRIYARGQSIEQFLVPGQTKTMGVKMEYSSGHVPWRARLSMIAQSAPMAIQRRLGYKAWRWLGFPYSEPGTGWKELRVEMPVTITPAQ